MFFMRIQAEKTELHKKVHRRICARDITFLAARSPTYAIFFAVSLSAPSLLSSPILLILRPLPASVDREKDR